MYYPKESKEPSGCMQTLVISRVILAILLVPMGIILGAIIAVTLTFYALTVNPLLGLLAIVIGASILIGLAKWELSRVAREQPRDD